MKPSHSTITNQAKNKMLSSTLALMFLITCCSFAQSSIEEGWMFWSKAELEQAEKIASEYISTDDGKHLMANILHVRGKYAESIKLYELISENYSKMDDVRSSMFKIKLFHLKDFAASASLANKISDNTANVFSRSLEKPMEADCRGTLEVPMLTSEPYNPFIPHIPASINGSKQKIAFDTGGNYLIMPKSIAENLGIIYDSTLFFTGQQGMGTSRMWVGAADELTLGEEVKLKNVPVIILEEMNVELIVFGTNILKEFLTTIDYPNNKFVFTTLNSPELIEAHRQNYSGNTMPFIMWGDHYMMGKGKYNGKNVNMFFDSGLVVVGQVNGEVAQSWMCLSKESMEMIDPR